MARQLPEPGRRVSLRRVRADGEQGDLIGFVITASESGLRLRDRRGHDHQVAWPDVVALRSIGVARGRDPLRTPLAELDALAEAAGLTGRVFVARVADLVDRLVPPPLEPGSPPPQPAEVAGEWVTTGTAADLTGLAWWAAHHDARSLQVRTADPEVVALLLAAGFTERGPTRPG
ncbi:MAG: hypothetical protein IT193_09705 [Propionibacteriaceae bacterium]|nr:hypothetical protein [Propionibacteriaceae bacterium]